MLALNARASAVRKPPPTTLCDTCAVRKVSVCGGVATEDLHRLNQAAERIVAPAGGRLVSQGDLSVEVLTVTSGSVRVFRLLEDGRRQITGFLFAGDFFMTPESDHAFSVEAIEPSSVCRFQRKTYEAFARATPGLEAALVQRLNRDLQTARRQAVLLGRKTALERLASFLLDLAEADLVRRAPGNQVRLPMTRAEIGDYLGLTIETVSRALARLRAAKAISWTRLDAVQIDHPNTLRTLAGG